MLLLNTTQVGENGGLIVEVVGEAGRPYTVILFPSWTTQMEPHPCWTVAKAKKIEADDYGTLRVGEGEDRAGRRVSVEQIWVGGPAAVGV